MDITTIGVDIAKNVFQIYGVDAKGNKVLSKRLRRDELLPYMAQLPCCLVGIEACGGAHYWARAFTQLGHTVKLMSPRYVKPYIKTNKNDANDAEGCCEAVTRPTMRFVPIKTIEQQDILVLHKVRSRLVAQSTELQNQMRGLLAEYGIVIAKGESHLRNGLAKLLDPDNNQLTARAKVLFTELQQELFDLLKRVEHCDTALVEVVKANDSCKRLKTIPGIGDITSSALVATIGDAKNFKKGRCFSAFLGLVPKQSSSGEKTRLLGISKRGNTYLRCLLVHGARSVIYQVMKQQKDDKRSRWLRQLVERVGQNKAIVALANKNARTAWAILAHETSYQINYQEASAS